MSENLNLIHERVDDIPLLLGVMQHLELPKIIDEHIGNHGHHQGWSNGELAMVWIAYILSEADHRKSVVQDWANRHRYTLERCCGKPFRSVEFSDDRLGILLKRLSNQQKWPELETDLWEHSVLVYDLEVNQIRLDSTTSYGYHIIEEDGLMQLGHSKDHRPDLGQLKLMAACADPGGHWLTSEVYPGNRADDGLYVPMIRRLQQMLKRKGLLYLGDSKMSALFTRAYLAAHGDYYLSALPQIGQTAIDMHSWISAAVEADQAATLIWQDIGKESGGASLIGAGYEFERQLNVEIENQMVNWTERVLVIRSYQLADQQDRGLEKRLKSAEAALLKLAPGRGKKVYDSQEELQQAAKEILAQYKVEGLLSYDWGKQEQRRQSYGRVGRPAKGTAVQQECITRYRITHVHRQQQAIAHQKQYHGWRVLVCNYPKQTLPFEDAYLTYRNGWPMERGFHLIKDKPIGTRPLHVRDDDQIRGLTYLLTIALRILSLIEIQVRKGIAHHQQPIQGLYPGQPNRTTERPTAKRLLQAIAKSEITLTRLQTGDQTSWHLTPLPQWIKQVLVYLKLSETVYTRLIENST
jgi:transposase